MKLWEKMRKVKEVWNNWKEEGHQWTWQERYVGENIIECA